MQIDLIQPGHIHLRSGIARRDRLPTQSATNRARGVPETGPIQQEVQLIVSSPHRRDEFPDLVHLLVDRRGRGDGLAAIGIYHHELPGRQRSSDGSNSAAMLTADAVSIMIWAAPIGISEGTTKLICAGET